MLKGIESFIDHIKSVETLGVCYWKKANNKKFNIGDICYLYLSDNKHNAIRYKLEVVDTSCERIDSDCWLKPFKPDKDCYKLCLSNQQPLILNQMRTILEKTSMNISTEDANLKKPIIILY